RGHAGMVGESHDIGIFTAAARGSRTFACPGIVRQGWYLVASSRKLRRGGVRQVEVGLNRLVAYRDLEGWAHVVDDRCPHLGSDLALARVTAEGLRMGLPCKPRRPVCRAQPCLPGGRPDDTAGVTRTKGRAFEKFEARGSKFEVTATCDVVALEVTT
ncbi:MAG: Rieske 2Fe-2S domain-containing protein, partial [Vicinamibacterales bacterium]